MRTPARALRHAARALLANRARALLAGFGVAVGTASVVVTNGVARGAAGEVLRRVDAEAANLMVVRPAEVRRLVARRTVRGVATTLTLADARAIADLPSVDASAPGVEVGGLVSAEEATARATVLGTGPAFLDVRRFRLAAGRFLDDGDTRAAARVAVLGSRVARGLFPGEDAIGRDVRIRRVPFEVVGVLRPRGASADGSDEDGLVLVPVTTALRRVANTTWLTSVLVRARGGTPATSAEREIRELLRERHRLAARGAPDDFGIQNQGKMVAMRNRAATTLTTAATGLSALALAVAGAGVLVLMLLSVKERTAEIGLRRAVGATTADVVLQVLGEASLLTGAGGVAGAVAGAGAARAIATATGWRVPVDVPSLAAALATIAAIGLLFGAYPAWAASRVPPATALST